MDATNWLSQCFQVLNRTYFEGVLPLVTLGFHANSEPIGLCHLALDGSPCSITVSEIFLQSRYRYNLTVSNRLAGDVLLHEMLHLYLVRRDKGAHICDCHGSTWIAACGQLAPKIGLYLDTKHIPRDSWAYFPHTFTAPAYYLDQSNTRRKIGDIQTIYDHTQE
jgi:hypothetical protein